jgi:hypothetical protein
MRSLSSIGSPEAKVVIASTANLAFLRPRVLRSLEMAVFLGAAMPLASSSERPSLALVGFFLIVPSNDRSWLGIMKYKCRWKY